MKKVTIIGGANVDIIGQPYNPLKTQDSNPGHITVQYGGVARNIAQVFTSLKTDVSLITCFGDDAFGQQLQKNCTDLGIDTSLSEIIPGASSSIYLAVLDETGDMHLGMSDMDILRQFDVTRLGQIVETLEEDSYLILDSNLEEEVLVQLASKAKCFLAADPVSVAKASRLSPILSSLQFFKPNQYEAALFTGIQIQDAQTAKASLQYFLDAGVSETIVSLADRGILLGTKTETLWLQHPPIEVKNATGGGDALFATYLTQRMMGKDSITSATYAMAAAITVITGQPMNLATIEKRKKEMPISLKIL